MAGPTFARRRARSRGTQLAAFGVVVALVSLTLGVLAGAGPALIDRGVRQVIADATPTAGAMRIQTRLSDDAQAQDETIRGVIRTALRDARADVLRTTMTDAAPTAIDGEPTPMIVASIPWLADHADLVEGDWPAADDEAALQAAAADALGLRVGDEFTIDDEAYRVTATWVPADAADPVWFADPGVASGAEGAAGGIPGPVVVDESAFAATGDTPVVRWTIVPDAGWLGAAEVGELAAGLPRLAAEVRALASGNPDAVDLLGTLGSTLSRADRAVGTASGVLGLPTVLLLIVGGVVLVLVARALADGRRAEAVLLRARGASFGALVRASAAEIAAVAALGALAGGAIALAVLAVVIGGSPTALAGAAAVGAVVAELLAVLLALGVIVATLRAPVVGRADGGRAALIASFAPLLLALVAAGLAVAQFVALGSPVVLLADGRVRVDPLALSAPVLLLVAAALAAPVIAGPLLALAERTSAGSRGILPALPLRQLARRSRAVASAVLVVALATGATVLAAAYEGSTAQAGAEATRAAIGADVRVAYDVRPNVDARHPAASAAAVSALAGVDDAFALLVATASAGSDPLPIVAADASRLAALPGADPMLAAVAPELAAARSGLPLPDGARELEATVTATFSRRAAADAEVAVAAWFNDADGVAQRRELGVVTVTQPTVALVGDVSTASTLLALEFTSTALANLDKIEMDVDTLEVDGAPLTGLATDSALITVGSTPVRLVADPRDDTPIPVMLSAAVAAGLGATVGDGLSLRIGAIGGSLPAVVAGVLDRVPGVDDPVALLVDLQVVTAYAVEAGGSVPAADEVWATTDRPDAVAAEIRATSSDRVEIVTTRSVSVEPLVVPSVTLLWVGVAAALALALAGFAAVAAQIGGERRAEIVPLRSLGMTVPLQASGRALERAATALVAVLLGAAAGLLTATVTVGGLVAATAGQPGAFLIAPGVLVPLGAAFAVAMVILILAELIGLRVARRRRGDAR